jgi:ribosome maturation factor RimP
MDPGSVAERVRKIAEQAADDHQVELVHAEVAGPEGHPIVRLFIDKPGGVAHDDCSKVSHQVSTVLDIEDFIHSAYVLEVSSPGLERGLYKRADYERFAGSQAKIKARSPINGQRNFRGRILGVADDNVIVADQTSGRVEIPLEGIVKANLEADLESELRLGTRSEADRNLTKDSKRPETS